MQRYKKHFNESRYNSGFRGFIIPDCNTREFKPIQMILKEEGILFDELKDHGYVHFVTDLDDKTVWEYIKKEIKKRTGKIIYDDIMNK